VIFTIIPATRTTSIESIYEKTIKDESSDWKTIYFCKIRGEHHGVGITPSARIGFALRLKISEYWDGYHDIRLIKGNESILISALKGFGFFGIIEPVFVPRVPVNIVGCLLYCQYKEKKIC
jgi:hypothetical protein